MPRHQPLQRRGVADEFRRLAFAQAAEIDELDVERAGLADGVEHLGLQRAGHIPGRLAAHRGVERQDQPADLPHASRATAFAWRTKASISLGAGPLLGRFGRASTGTGGFLSLIGEKM